MPIKIPNDLPASKILKEENIFVMDETRALSQRIRPLKLIIVNIMPTKIVTETQLLRLLSNTPLQIEVDWLCMESHNSKNTSQEHLMEFYKTFNEDMHLLDMVEKRSLIRFLKNMVYKIFGMKKIVYIL